MPDASAPEAARNRDLRRHDWRFLQPGVQLERLDLCTLDSLRSVPPGCAVYVECRRSMLGGGKALRARLAAAGLEAVEIYWPWPRMDRPWFWLPVGSEAAIGYVAATRLPAPNPLRRTLNRPLLALWRRAAATERLWPLCAVARTPGPATGESLRGRIEREWESWNLGPRPDRLTWMVLTRGGRSINKVVGLVFAEPDPAPRIAVKLARTPEAEPGLHRESQALAAIHARTPGGLRGAPRVLFCDTRSGTLALGETGMVGRPLFSLLRERTYRELALAAAGWLTELAGPLARATAGAAEHVVHRVLGDFVAAFGSVVEPDELRRAERLVEPLARLPSVPEHRDYSPWNVHLAADGIVVHDWESAEPAGLPLTDLVYFLAYLAFFRARVAGPERCARWYRLSRDPGTPVGAVHHAVMARYLAHTGLDPAHVHGLHLLTWMIHSRSEYLRLVADAAGPPARGALARSLFLALWREELRR